MLDDSEEVVDGHVSATTWMHKIKQRSCLTEQKWMREQRGNEEEKKVEQEKEKHQDQSLVLCQLNFTEKCKAW